MIWPTESDLQHHSKAWALPPHEGPLRQQFQRPRPQVMGLPGSEGAVKLGEMFLSRHRGAAGAEQEGLGGMFLDPKVVGRTGMEGHEGLAGDKLRASQSALNLLSRPGLSSGVMRGCREFWLQEPPASLRSSSALQTPVCVIFGK